METLAIIAFVVIGLSLWYFTRGKGEVTNVSKEDGWFYRVLDDNKAFRWREDTQEWELYDYDKSPSLVDSGTATDFPQKYVP